MILHVDMDGVVADFNTGYFKLDPELGNTNIWTKDRSKRVEEVCLANPRFFRDLPPIEGALAAVRELSEIYEIYFVSTPMWVLPESFMDKRLWLEMHFGEWATKRLILTHRKDLCIGDFLIDDNRWNGVENFQGEHIHIFTDPRFSSWGAVAHYLKTKSLI